MNIFTKLRQELEKFEKSISVVPDFNRGSVRYGGQEDDMGFMFNQKETLQTVELYHASRFKNGRKDIDGKRKLFLNIVKFNQEVAEKQTDIDVKNYLFIPDSAKDIDASYLLSRQFMVWTRENDYGQLLNDLNKDYTKFGTCVVKKVKDGLERVPLFNLINTQDADSLEEAARTGGYVIEKHKMSPTEIKKMPDWRVPEEIDEKDEKITVYERYSLVPLSKIKEYRGEDIEEGDENEKVLAVAILVPDMKSFKKKKGEEEGKILFMEEVDETPYEEAHYSRRDNRWLGEGVVETLIENQIEANLTANLRRRSLMWAAKKLFQSRRTNDVVKNLVKDVEDGQVIEVGAEGQISPIATENRALQEIQQDINEWSQNTKQKSFSFEMATGESPPSGTPFRLGVVLSNSVQSHFNLKRENFGLFLERSFFKHLIPIFKRKANNKDYLMSIASNEEGIERIKQAFETKLTNQRFFDKLLKRDIKQSLLTGDLSFENERQKVREKLRQEPYFFINIPKGFYEDIKFHLELEITGESVDVQEELTTLTTIFQTVSRNPQALDDPRIERLLEIIVSKTGKDLDSILGNVSKGKPDVTQAVQQFKGEGLQGLNQNQNENQRQPQENV